MRSFVQVMRVSTQSTDLVDILTKHNQIDRGEVSYKLAHSIPVTTGDYQKFYFFFLTFIMKSRAHKHIKEFFVVFHRLKCRIKLKIVKILHGYFDQDSVYCVHYTNTSWPCNIHETFFYVCRTVHPNIYFYSKTNKMHNIANLFYFGTTLYMFRTVFSSIVRSLRLHIQHHTIQVLWLLASKQPQNLYNIYLILYVQP